MTYPCLKNKKITQQTEKLISFLKTVSIKNRLKILCLLKKGEQCVCEICDNLNLPQNLVSHHLKSLKKIHLIKSRREGTKIYYSLNHTTINQYINHLQKLLK